MKVFALTGGIAAGKSEASRRFTEAGVPVVDADIVAHGVMEPGGRAFEAVSEHFGEAVLSEGRIDREKLGAVVFHDREQLERLNSMVHPAVQLEIAQALADLAGRDTRAAIVDAALHAENGELSEGMAGLILVHAPVEDRLHRLKVYRGIDRAEGLRRIAAQTPPEEKMALADWIIENTDTLETLQRRVDEVALELLR